jgi:hypothetical protein
MGFALWELMAVMMIGGGVCCLCVCVFYSPSREAFVFISISAI